jgi:ubiquinone/menaquinone biosynthesis C-methylase UbiE
MSSVNEIYQHGHHTSVVSSHAKRTAETDAAFFLPYLKPGMRLLDVGCGPGSITVGLALRVEPAPTVGMDASESVIETARSLAKARPARYLTFEVGNIYEPHFTAENFDAIFAHQVLQHLRRPVDALRQCRALLRSGGVVGVRDVDWGSTTFYPENQGIRRFLTLYYELARRNGGEPNAGRYLRHWFRGGICRNSCNDIDRVLHRPGRNADMGGCLRRPHFAFEHCREISGIWPCQPFRTGGYCCRLACLGPGSRRVVVLQQHRNGSLETIAEMAEDRCAKLMRSGGVAAVLTVTFHLTSGSWTKDVRCLAPRITL